MARVLFVPREQLIQGTVKLYRGDEWDVEGKVQNLVGGVALDDDLSSCSGLTAYFPGNPAIVSECVIIDAACGKFRASVPASGSLDASLTDGPTSWYAIGDFADGVKTIATVDRPLEVLDRGFQS